MRSDGLGRRLSETSLRENSWNPWNDDCVRVFSMNLACINNIASANEFYVKSKTGFAYLEVRDAIFLIT